MDTNLVQALAQLMQQNKSSFDPSAIIIISVVMGGMIPTLAAIAGYFKAKAANESSKLALVNSETTKKTALDTAEEVKNIHIAVNSERSAMLEKVQQLTDKMLLVSRENEGLREKNRGMELAAATLTIPAQHRAPAETIAAIKETTAAVKEVEGMVASDVSVTDLMKKLIEVLELHKVK